MLEDLSRCKNPDDRIASLRSHDCALVRRTLVATYDMRRSYRTKHVDIDAVGVGEATDEQWSSFLDVLHAISCSTHTTPAAAKKLICDELADRPADFQHLAKFILGRHFNVGISISLINAALGECIFTFDHQKTAQYDDVSMRSSLGAGDYILIEPSYDAQRVTVVVDFERTGARAEFVNAWTTGGATVKLSKDVNKQARRLHLLERMSDCVLTGYDVVDRGIVVDAVIPLHVWMDRGRMHDDMSQLKLRHELEDMRSQLTDMDMSVIEQHAVTCDDIESMREYFSNQGQTCRGLTVKRMTDRYSWTTPSAYTYMFDEVFEGTIDGFVAGTTRVDSDHVVTLSVRLRTNPSILVNVNIGRQHHAIARKMWYNRTRYRGRMIKFRASSGIYDNGKIHDAKFEALADEDG